MGSCAGRSVHRYKWRGRDAQKNCGVKGGLARGDTLHVEIVALRPHHFVFGSTVRAERQALDLFSQPRGSDYTHPTLTIVTSEDVLHMPSLSNLEKPELRNSSSVRRGFGRRVKPVLRHLMRSPRERFNLHAVKVVKR
jgi:hypothetical protein